MAFKKGEGGRPKGTTNKVPQALKEMILQALDGAGGVTYLQSQSKENPAAFLTLVGKVLPLQIGGVSGGVPITTRVIHTFTDVADSRD